MSWFLRGIKSSVRQSWRYDARSRRKPARFPVRPPSTFSSELRSWPGISPETCLRWRLLHVPCRRNIFRLLSVHTLFLFSDSLSAYAQLSLCFLCTTLQNIPLQSSQGSEQGLNANKRCYEFIYDDHGVGVYSCSRLVPLYDPLQRCLDVSPFPAGMRDSRKVGEEIDWDVSPSKTDIKTVWGRE